MKLRFDPEVSATVSYSSACVLVMECFAGADADRMAELVAVLAPHLQGCIHAYIEAISGSFVLPEPSLN